MGGRAAEQIVFGQTSTGAANDLAGATDLATRMVHEFGMSGSRPPSSSHRAAMYLDNEEVKNRQYAEATTATRWTISPSCCWNEKPLTALPWTTSPAIPQASASRPRQPANTRSHCPRASRPIAGRTG
jgi:hypothetical protein